MTAQHGEPSLSRSHNHTISRRLVKRLIRQERGGRVNSGAHRLPQLTHTRQTQLATHQHRALNRRQCVASILSPHERIQETIAQRETRVLHSGNQITGAALDRPLVNEGIRAGHRTTHATTQHVIFNHWQTPRRTLGSRAPGHHQRTNSARQSFQHTLTTSNRSIGRLQLHARNQQLTQRKLTQPTRRNVRQHSHGREHASSARHSLTVTARVSSRVIQQRRVRRTLTNTAQHVIGHDHAVPDTRVMYRNIIDSITRAISAHASPLIASRHVHALSHYSTNSIVNLGGERTQHATANSLVGAVGIQYAAKHKPE